MSEDEPKKHITEHSNTTEGLTPEEIAAGITIDPVLGKVAHGYVVGDRVKSVPDGTRRLNSTHFMPEAETPVDKTWKQHPPKESIYGKSASYGEGQEFDSLEWREKHGAGRGNLPGFLKIEDGKLVTVTPASWKETNPDISRENNAYTVAVQNRAAGLPYDADCIALHLSDTWKDRAFKVEFSKKKAGKK